MRSTGGRGAGVALAMLAACSGDPSPSPQAVRAVEASAREAVRPLAGGAVVREPPPPLPPPMTDPATLRSRLHDDPAAVGQILLTRAEIEHLGRDRRIDYGGYGTSHLFADFEADGCEEVVLAIGKGWWEDGFDLCTFAPAGRGFRLVDLQRIDAHGRYAPGLRHLAADHPQFFQAARTTGTGTGICVGHQQLFEFVHGRPVECLSVLDHAEYAPYGFGPSFRILTGDFQIVGDPASDGVVARSTLFLEVFDDLGPAFEGRDLEFGLEFRRGVPGGRFVLQRPIGWQAEDLTLQRLVAIGMRAWFEHYEQAALAVAVNGSPAQQKFLRRAAAVARDGSAHRVADAVLARLPVEAAAGR